MSVNPQETIDEQNVEQQKKQDAEINFAQLRRKLESEQQARMQAEQRAMQLEKLVEQKKAQSTPFDDDDDDDEPYVDKKKLNRKMNSFEQRVDEKIDRKAEEKATQLFRRMEEQRWLDDNPDYYDVMQHAQKIQERSPNLAKTILAMPEGLERNRLVYENIKFLGLHKKEDPKPSIQETIDRNRRNPYYQPSGQSAPPYGAYSAGGKEVSEADGKNAYKKMQELKRNLRI